MLKNRAPIQDAIDRRNYKKELGSTVIKRSRVHFITQDELDQEELENELVDKFMAEQEMAYADDNNSGYDDSSELDLSGISEEVLSQADEIFARLQREAAADEEARTQEWIQKIMEENKVEEETLPEEYYNPVDENSTNDEEYPDEYYNPTTGSYSGAYGKGEISDETRRIAEEILAKANQ